MRSRPSYDNSTREASSPARTNRASNGKRAGATRFSARAFIGSRVQEIGIDPDLGKVVAHARSHHEKCGQPTWVWNVRTGATVFRIGGDSRRALESGGRRARKNISLPACCGLK